ncbi:hypothetical protein [Actinotignum urinale]|uniref:hypothetical protein n=1 Tax=Actinotignum urinale TaxID=190146 RepID=UPI0003F51A42|nr:hypothetical protein [Actinotignum urinale]
MITPRHLTDNANLKDARRASATHVRVLRTQQLYVVVKTFYRGVNLMPEIIHRFRLPLRV